MNELKFWKNILNELNNNKRLVLLIVADASFSSPGKQGFKMLVTEDGTIYGTIGGGIMEKEMAEYSLDFLFGNKTLSLKKLYHNPNTRHEASGLICGGNQTIILKVISANEKLVVEKILENIERNEPAQLRITENAIEYSDAISIQDEIRFKAKSSGWEYIEKIGQRNTIYIAGGGHVGLAISRVMNQLGFYIKIFDHRQDVFTLEENIFADEKIILKDYYQFGDFVEESDKSFVVIVTSKHLGDKEALQSVIGKRVKYIGMMGSKRKIKTIFDALKSEGVTTRELEKVHSPIGLEIEAETPEEIAISVAAEIIKIKNSVNI